ncbi:MAG: hypothetical protein J2P15_11255 [Micromonosporaceae bacterium]|nr:hypothetical protein [Micromonosporaceae bacterium]
MPGDRHDGFAEMFERCPALVRVLLGAAAALLPEGAPVRVASNEFSHYKPTNYHADRVLVFGSPPDEVAVIVEIQRRFREEKLRVWPFYVASLWARDGYPVILLVLCDDAKTAAAYDRPIRIGRAAVVRPDVVGPDRVPVVRDPRLARDLPELAVISAILHHDRPGSEEIFRALATALMTVGTELGRQYYDLVFAELPEPRQLHLQEVVMTTLTPPYRSVYNRTIWSAGVAEGEAKAILTVLESRGFTLTDEVRNRVTGCTDRNQLEAWLHRVGTITAIEELFS